MMNNKTSETSTVIASLRSVTEPATLKLCYRTHGIFDSEGARAFPCEAGQSKAGCGYAELRRCS